MQKLKKENFISILILLATAILYFLYSYKNYDLFPSNDDVQLKKIQFFQIPLDNFGDLIYPSLMYFFSLFTKNNINLIFSFYFTISIITFFAFYSYLRYSKIGFKTSYFLSAAFLFSNFQIYLTPRLTLLNLIFGFIFLSIISTKSKTHVKWALMTVCLLLCNYVSVPEFLIFFIVSFLIFIYKAFSNTTLSVAEKAIPLCFILVIMAVLFYLGGGIQNESVFVVEYKYHFLDNWELWTGEHYDFQDELNVFDRVYGKANSLFEFITVNPKLFFKHIIYNFGKYFVTVFGIFKSCFYMPFTSFLGHYTKYVILVLAAILIFTINLKATFVKFREQLKIHKDNILFLEIFSLPGFVIAILVYPRNHFTILDLPIYFLILGIILNSVILKTNTLWKFGSFILLICFILGIYNSKPRYNPNGNVAFYQFVEKLSNKKQLAVLSNDYFGYYYFAGHTTLKNYDANKDDLVKILNTQQFDILTMHHMDTEVPANREFLKKNYLKTDYVRIRKFEESNRYIFIKKNLVPLITE